MFAHNWLLCCRMICLLLMDGVKCECFSLEHGITIKYQRQFPADSSHLLFSTVQLWAFKTFEKYKKCELYVEKSWRVLRLWLFFGLFHGINCCEEFTFNLIVGFRIQLYETPTFYIYAKSFYKWKNPSKEF